ncbi:MAG: OmpA family protein [Candidatus Latescibacteria bacterium]|jgi:chemotaxis protein MotB|nr:OmpA family protein [Candidatus Latescibacterota bacterium]MBT4140460.1 OmpA family protein [Candidatus Latescibacterota bacterium]
MGKMIKDDECPEGLPGWLATFGDLMSLLLTFFVLLLSFATMEVVEFQQAMGALQGALGVLSGEPQLNLPIRQSMPKSEGNLQQAEVIAKAAQELESAIEEAGLQGDVELEESTTGLIIRVSNKLLFSSADTELKPTSVAFLNKLGDLLKPMTNPINVQGHTDNRTINTLQYASNWELSGMRALQVARHFIDGSGISPSRVSFTGYSEYRWIVPNNSDENMAKNRRVEIHILYEREPHAPPKTIYEAVESNQIEVQGREIE